MAGDSWLTLNSFDCIRGRITLPRKGVWVADLVVEPTSDTADLPANGDPVTVNLQAGQITFNGTVRRIQNAFGTVLCRVVGGGGGFPQIVQPKAYQGVTFQFVLNDLLGDLGETLSSQSNSTDLNLNLPTWVRNTNPGWIAMGSLMSEVSPDTWRILPDGTTWVGPDVWPASSMTSYDILDYAPQELRAEVYSDTPNLLPGQSFMGGMVSTVEHHIEPDKLFMRILFEDPQLATIEAM